MVWWKLLYLWLAVQTQRPVTQYWQWESFARPLPPHGLGGRFPQAESKDTVDSFTFILYLPSISTGSNQSWHQTPRRCSITNFRQLLLSSTARFLRNQQNVTNVLRRGIIDLFSTTSNVSTFMWVRCTRAQPASGLCVPSNCYEWWVWGIPPARTLIFCSERVRTQQRTTGTSRQTTDCIHKHGGRSGYASVAANHSTLPKKMGHRFNAVHPEHHPLAIPQKIGKSSKKIKTFFQRNKHTRIIPTCVSFLV